MNDQNRYEEVPQKENKFLKGLKAFGNYLKFVFVDFFNSFKYNNMKLAAILFAMPGILLGFFMFAHVPTIRHVTVSYQTTDLKSEMNIGVTEDTGGDYLLTIAKYNINGKDYTNIEMELNKPNITTDNQDNYPVNSEAVEGKTTQISKPSMTFTQVISGYDDSGNIEYSEDQYEVTVNLSEDEQTHVAKYIVFIFITAKNGKDYQLENYYSFTNTETTLNISNLGKSPYKYKAVVKAIAQSEGVYYSSNLSDEVEISVNSNGSAYEEAKFNFVQYQGDYKVKSVDGELTNDIKDFTMTINADGTAKYNDKAGNNEKDGQLQASGTSLISKELFTVHILPFDFSGISIFFLTLLGFLNVFLALELSKKKNFGTVIKCCITTGLICILAVLYIYSIFATNSAMNKKENALVLAGTSNILDSNAIISMVTVIAACVFSLAGLVLAFINYDRTYEKVDR